MVIAVKRRMPSIKSSAANKTIFTFDYEVIVIEKEEQTSPFRKELAPGLSADPEGQALPVRSPERA